MDERCVEIVALFYESQMKPKFALVKVVVRGISFQPVVQAAFHCGVAVECPEPAVEPLENILAVVFWKHTNQQGFQSIQ